MKNLTKEFALPYGKECLKDQVEELEGKFGKEIVNREDYKVTVIPDGVAVIVKE